MRHSIFKKFILSVFASVFAISAIAQSPITLSATNETALQTGVYHGRVVNTATLMPPSIGANKTWDYSNLHFSPVYTNSLIQATTFSSTAVADTTATETIGNGLVIPVASVYDMDASGFFGAGAIILKQSFTLGAVTGNNNDSLIFQAQVYKYRQNILAFPATYNSVWQSKITHAINFIVNAPSKSLFNAKASKVSHATVIDSVVGWGTLSIPSSNKASIPYPVLLVKEQTKTIDSFFLYGGPAPKALLDSFGVTQGMASYDYSEYFYRTGTVEPLMTIDYNADSTYTNPSAASFTADNVQSGIGNASASFSSFSLYPNPATSGKVECSFNKFSMADWQLNVVNSLGQLIRSQTLSGTGDMTEQIDLSSVRSGGLYIVNVVDENGTLIETGRLSVIR